MKRGDCTGMTLVDSMAGVAVVTLLVGMAVPFLMAAREQSRVSAAAAYLSAQAMLARSRAVQHGAAVGLRFEADAGAYRFGSYVDGDGDGIRTSDVSRGIDRPLGPAQRLGDVYPSVRFGLLASVPPIGSSRAAGSDADPIRFGRGDTLTFSPLGTATSGTLYLRGAADTMREWGSRYARVVLDRCNHNKREACRMLGISYHTLQAYLTYEGPKSRQ